MTTKALAAAALAALTALAITLLAIFAAVLYQILTAPLLDIPQPAHRPAHAGTAPPAPLTAVQLTPIPCQPKDTQ